MSLERGCKTAIETCIGVSEGEEVVIVCDEQSKNIGTKLKEIVKEITPHIRFFTLEIYGDRPLDHFPERIKKPTQEADIAVWTARSIKGELESIRHPFMEAAMLNGRLAHMVDIDEEIIEKGLTGDYGEIVEFTEKINEIAKKTDEVRIESELCTDLNARVRKYKWVAETGVIRNEGEWVNLPGGEIYTTPQSMEGRAVITGTLGDYFHDKYSISDVEENPVVIDIDNEEIPRVNDIECDNAELLEDLEEYISREECSRYVGELGIGTNINIEGLIGSMLIDEKYPNVHIALGDPNAGETYAGWSCSTHLDMIMRECDVWFDDRKILEKGEFVPELRG